LKAGEAAIQMSLGTLSSGRNAIVTLEFATM
jgi:hypothetical protein